MMIKRYAVGVSDFKKIVDPQDNYLYVDKTLFIKEILEDSAEVVLIPRPRRWGKTLNMSMLYYYFVSSPQEKKQLFQGLEISTIDNGRFICLESFLVNFISFHTVKANNYD